MPGTVIVSTVDNTTRIEHVTSGLVYQVHRVDDSPGLVNIECLTTGRSMLVPKEVADEAARLFTIDTATNGTDPDLVRRVEALEAGSIDTLVSGIASGYGYDVSTVRGAMRKLIAEWTQHEDTVRHMVHAWDDGTLTGGDHEHFDVYADKDHDHEGVYAEEDHEHENVAERDHDHEDVYASEDHDHDVDFEALASLCDLDADTLSELPGVVEGLVRRLDAMEENVSGSVRVMVAEALAEAASSVRR